MYTVYTMHQNCVHFVMETQKRLFTRAVSLQSVAMCALAVQFVNFVLRSGGGALCTLGNGNTKGGLQSRGANRRNQGGGRGQCQFYTNCVYIVQPSQLCTAGVALAEPVIASKSIKSAGPVD